MTDSMSIDILTDNIKTNIPNLFDYMDYRKFMVDYRKAKSAHDPGFTHYYICYCLGMKNSRGYYNNITSRRKNLSQETTEKFIDLFGFSPDEARYFRVLVNYNQSEHPERKELYFHQLVMMKHSKKEIIPEDCYEYFTTWYHPVVREKLEGFQLKRNFAELAEQLIPPITAEQTQSSVELLERLNLIGRDETGTYRVIAKSVGTDPNVQQTTLKQYQLISFDRAYKRIQSSPKDHKTTTLTFAISPKAFELINFQIVQLKKAIHTIAREDDAESKKVFELLLHLSKQSK